MYWDSGKVGVFELYAVTDRKLLGGVSEVEAARLCYEGGADAVQLRLKDADGAEMLALAKRIKGVADEHGKFFFVNDRVDVAVLAGADGVHLGQADIPVREARRLCGGDMVIGVSVGSTDEAVRAVQDGADYVAVGAVFGTSTKPDAKQGVGLDAVFDVKQAVDVPVVAIGGINRGNILEVMHAGADSVAVASAIMGADDIRGAAHELKTLILNDRRGAV